MKRTQITSRSGKKFYVIRDSRGRIRDVQNIGRAIHADSKIKARNVPVKPNPGFMGDYVVSESGETKFVPLIESSLFGSGRYKRKGLW